MTEVELADWFSWVQRERMQDVPILHPGLQVEAVGFCDWEGGRLGVLITPWFMNLIFIPGLEEIPETLQTQGHLTLPGATFPATPTDEQGIGRWWSSGLESPMFRFADQAAAVAEALAVLERALRRPEPAPVAQSRRDFLRGRLGG